MCVCVCGVGGGGGGGQLSLEVEDLILLQQLSGWLVSDDHGGEDAGCGGPGLVWLHVVCG